MLYERFGTSFFLPDNGEHDISTADSRSVLNTLPSGGSFDAYGDAQSPRQARQIALRARLLGASTADLQTQFDALRAKRGRRDQLYARAGDGTVRWTWARMLGLAATRSSEQSQSELDISMSFELAYPIWYGTEHGGENWEWDSGVSWDSGVAWEQRTGDVFTITPDTLNTNVVTNAGNATTRIVTYTIEVPGGAGAIAPVGGDPSITITTVPAEDVSLTSQLVYYGTIADGATLSIDAGSMSITNDTVGDYANLAFGVNHTIGGWVVLGPGENSIQTLYTGATNAILTVDFSDAWE